MGLRQDYKSVNLLPELVQIVDLCVTTCIKDGEPVYSRREFVKQALEAKIEKERKRYKELDRLINIYYNNKRRVRQQQ